MKKINICLMALCLSLTFNPLSSNAKTIGSPDPIEVSNPAEPPAEIKVLLLRLDEIKMMDKSNLKAPEKKQLRKEVRAIKEKLTTVGGGVYISGGALILIIILLIIFL